MGGMMGCARLTITISRWSSSQNIVSVFVSWEMNASAFFKIKVESHVTIYC